MAKAFGVRASHQALSIIAWWKEGSLVSAEPHADVKTVASQLPDEISPMDAAERIGMELGCGQVIVEDVGTGMRGLFTQAIP